MDEQTLNRRQILGGMAAGAAGMLGGAGARTAAAADVPVPDVGPSQPPPITDVKDKVAYVTGGSSGIGLGVARVFHEAGMKVVIGYLDELHIGDALKHFPPGDPRIHAIRHDVMDRDAWERVADEIEKTFGPLHVLVNNAGVGLQAPASTGTYKDWEWGLGVNLWGPIYGVHTYVPRMLASKQGSQIVTTTSTSGILPGSGAGIYTVSKIAAVGLMEELRQELRRTNIGTTCFIPGLTATNIGQSEHYRPAALRNDGPPALPPGAQPRPPGSAPPRPRGFPAPVAGRSPAATRPMDPLVCGHFVLNGILNNDLYVVAEPEYRLGVEARCNALLESMIPFKPLPPELVNARVYRTPIYLQEIAHRHATQVRDIAGT
ncbi:MAG TPA: SDR family NAD(P)-dependent oxidoreductase [Steroidobacteraceae bacterium]|nr:SDR family NAD(P)-dependent oxidoreductase [Steroidobacteraceae bacterium]